MAHDLVAGITDRVIPAVPVPFGADGALDTDAQAAYTAWMARQPVGAVAVWAHTGRGLRLDAEQRAAVLAAWRNTAPELPVICGVGAPAGPARTDQVIRAAVAMAEAARSGGAAGLLLHPPTALRDLPDAGLRVLDVHRAVADVGLPVIAFYLYDAAGGIAYDDRMVEELLGLDGVIGMKIATLDSVVRFQELVPLIQRAGRLVITGEDRFLGYSLMLGARSALVGMAAACTDRVAALVAAWRRRELERFVALAQALDVFAAATFGPPVEGYVQRMLWALETDGVLPSGARDPFAPPLAPEEQARVVRAVRALRGA